MNNNFENKTLEEIENDFWGTPKFSSSIVKTCYQLRKKRIVDFEIEDLRMMIGQDIGLSTLIPLAIQKLKNDILAEGDYYEGDLLYSVLTAKSDFWEIREDLKQQVIILFESNIMNINESDLSEEIRQKIFEAYNIFKGL